MIRLREHIAVLAAVLLSAAAFAQYPAGTNKIRLGAQTSGDGLVFRGVVGDTVTVKPTTVNNAYFLLDTLSGTLYRYIKSRQGWQPVSAAAPTIILDGEVNGATNATTVDTVRRIWFDRTYTAPDALGKLQWNANEGTLNLGVGFDGVVLQLGQETFYPNVINKTGSLIKNGTVVMVDPVTPVQGDHIRVVPANGSGIYPSKLVMGVITQDLAFDSLGLVTWFGFVREVKESDIVQTGITLAVGDVLYLSATQPGKVTNVEPTAPAIKVAVALLVRKPNANNLTLLVRPWLNEDLKELNDVRQDVGVQNQVIRYDLATGVWIASTTAGIVAGDTASMLSTYLRPSEILAGAGITLSKDSTVTISAPTTLSSSTAIIDVAEVVVDALSTLRLPWDGAAVVGVIKTGLYLTNGVNEAFVQHELIPNGDKGDITTSAGGAVMTIDTGAVTNSKANFTTLTAPADTAAQLLGVTTDGRPNTVGLAGGLTLTGGFLTVTGLAGGTVTSVQGGNGIITDPAPGITAAGTVRADTGVLASKVWANNALALKLNAADTASLSNRINLKLNIADTASMLTNYINAVDTAAMLLPYLRKADTLSMLSTYINASDTAAMLLRYVNFADTAAMLLPYLRKADTTAMLSTYINAADTAAMLSTYINAADTAAMLTNYINAVDTALMLSTYINAADTAAMLTNYINAVDTAAMLSGYIKDSIGTVTSTNLASSAVTEAKIATGAVTGIKIAENTVDSLNLKNGAAGGIKLGRIEYLTLEDVDVNLANYLGLGFDWFGAGNYSQTVLYLKINNVNRTVTLPAASAANQGKILEVFFATTNGATYYGSITGDTNNIQYRDGANVADTTTYNLNQKLIYAKLMSTRMPGTTNYKWVVLDSRTY